VKRLLPVLLLSLVAACVSGTRVEGEMKETREGVMALRWGPAGSGLVHGEGLATEQRFWIDVDGAPPAAAFHQGVAVGEMVLLGTGSSVRLGMPLDDVHGVADGVAVVFRQKALGVDTEWAAVFPEGISCATQGAETWEPADCQSLDPLVFQ
tara:strand:- start:1855 stop:2310 length:456 start_codon:yes stop_codon:yes gene_type:complete